MKYLISLLLLASCATPRYTECPQPPAPTAYINECQSQTSTDVYIAAFIEILSKSSLPQNVARFNELLKQTELVWQYEPFTAPELPYLLAGLTYPPQNGRVRMYVYQPPDCPDLSCTSFGHELLHLWLYAATNDLQVSHLTNTAEWPLQHQYLLFKVRLAFYQKMYTYNE